MIPNRSVRLGSLLSAWVFTIRLVLCTSYLDIDNGPRYLYCAFTVLTYAFLTRIYKWNLHFYLVCKHGLCKYMCNQFVTI